MRQVLWAKALGLALGIGLVGLGGCETLPGRTRASEEGMKAAGKPVRTVVAGDRILLPTPRSVVSSDGFLQLLRGYSIVMAGVPETCAGKCEGYVHNALDPLCSPTESATIRDVYQVALEIDPAKATKAEGYLLVVDGAGVYATGHDERGLFYALMTLTQLARQTETGTALPYLRIEDWPDFPNRGVLLDVARDKVPEMSTLYALVDKLAEWKFNQLQLYTEHSFAYRGHHTVWEDASPMTPAQIRALDAYCRARYIELVPNQNSFGHMGRWLGHTAYTHLAEMPGGGSDLCPVDPRSIELLADMYAHLLPNFSSRQFNVGCDETWSLGKGRSKEAVEKRGVGPVYFDFLMQIHGLLQQHGRTMQFWGDIIMSHPELIPKLPKDVIAMEWGYEAAHPFAEHGKQFAKSGVPFYVVPGTSTWNSLVGRTDNALENLRNAAENGRANGAIGYLITDWGDGGHWQFQPASYLGFGYGAGVSWCYETNQDIDICHAVDVHAFEDAARVMGRLAYDLGNAYQKCGVMPGNSSIYYYLLQHRVEEALDEALTVEGLEATIAYVDEVMAKLPEARMACADAELIVKEYAMSAALIRFACRLGVARIEAGRVATSAIPAEGRHALAVELEALLPEFRQLWLARNRSGGLRESVGRFERLLALLKAT